MQRERPTTLLRKVAQSTFHNIEFLAGQNEPLGRWLCQQFLEERGGRTFLPHRPASKAIDRNVGGGAEEIGAEKPDGAGIFELQYPDVRLLGGIPRLAVRVQPCRQKAHQRAVVIFEELANDG
jgi:hypothetical protein